MDLTKSTLGKCILFGALYFPEGLMGALATVIVPLYLASNGFSASIVGLVMGLTTIPWVIKFVWGFIVDYHISKGRRYFVLMGGILGATMSALLFFISPSWIFIFTAALFVARSGIAILDVSTDAFSIETTKFHERGKVNGSMFFGQLSGFAFGSLVLTKISSISFPIVFLSVGILIMLLLGVVLFAREKTKRKHHISHKDLIHAFRHKAIFLIILFSVFVGIPSGFISGMATYYMKVYLAISATTIGLISLFNGISNALGAYGFGALSDKLGRMKAIFVAIIPAIIFTLFFSVFNSFPLIYVLYGIFVGGITAVMCALFMDVTSKKVAATEYAILTSLANFGIFIGTTTSGFLLQSTGPKLFFMIAAALYIPSIIVLYLLSKKL
ncbi:MAG: MFS transporter [Nanoarchaeota archaeon]|nr:MFS transporter [Nanoarchaeota archaeon]